MSGNVETGQPKDHRHELLDAIEGSILEGDYPAAIGLVKGTNLLRPFEIVEYLDVKDRHCESPEDQKAWRGVLSRYLGSLAGQEFPPEEESIITDATRRLEFEVILENGSLTSTAEVSAIATNENEVDAYGWDNDEFHVRLDPETIERVRATPIFQTVERFSPVTKGVDGLRQGLWIIKKNLQGRQREEALIVFDETLYRQIRDRVSRGHPDFARFGEAATCKGMIDEYASSHAVAVEMQRANDKYIFRAAERARKEERSWNRHPEGDAVNIVHTGTSSRARRDAMMDLLDLDRCLLPYEERRLSTDEK